jgi:hypothetical protein
LATLDEESFEERDHNGKFFSLVLAKRKSDCLPIRSSSNFMRRKLDAGPVESLSRLKRAAEQRYTNSQV